jgi:hypothetical protein
MSPIPADVYESRSEYRLPAWLFSALVHLGLLIVGVLLVPAVTERASEPPREVGIVLATAGGSPDYYTDEPSDATDAATAAASESGSAGESARGDPHGALLPAADIKLPDLPGGGATPLGDPTGLLDQPRLRVAGRPHLPGLDDAAILAQEAEFQKRKPGPSGPKTRLAPFASAPAVGNSFVFLIDRSQSMGGQGIDGLAAAETELKKQLALLGEEHKFQLVAYNQGLLYMTRPRLEPATVENRKEADKFLHGLVAFSATQHEMALMAGLRLSPDVIFLLTDGGDPPLDAGAVRRITERNGKRTSIHCIVFGRGAEPTDVQGFRALVAANGGAYGYVDLDGRR